ncbi:hypothetical protein GCM10018954_071120 [Kutzneria kofuensis]
MTRISTDKGREFDQAQLITVPVRSCTDSDGTPHRRAALYRVRHRHSTAERVNALTEHGHGVTPRPNPLRPFGACFGTLTAVTR